MGEIGVGKLGYAFMGKAHSHAFKTIEHMTWPPPLEPRLVGIAGRDADAVGEAAKRYGYEYATGNWRELIADDRIGLFDNGGPHSLPPRPPRPGGPGGEHRRSGEPRGRGGEANGYTWAGAAAPGGRSTWPRT